jgi:Ca2+:H+ antiporter
LLLELPRRHRAAAPAPRASDRDAARHEAVPADRLAAFASDAEPHAGRDAARRRGAPLKPLFEHIRHTRLLWLLVAVPVVLVTAKLKHDAHTLLFALSVLAIVPLAALLSHATESVAARTGDAVGGLLNATLGNLTELVIAITALKAGEYMLVKASIAGAIVTNTLFMLGASFLLGGLKHHVQEYNRAGARLQAALLFLATVALLVPSVVVQAESTAASQAFTQEMSLGLAGLLITVYGLSMVFSLGTHRELFASVSHAEEGEAPWPMGLALATLAGVTVLVAMVSEIFVESVQEAAKSMGMTPAFVGFIVVALVGGAAEMASAFSGARKNRLDLSVGIALGSASQIALFVAPVLVLLSYVVGPTPMDLQFWPGAVAMMLIAAMTASLVTNSGRSAWFVGVLVLTVYVVFAMMLYLLPPRAS